MPITMYAYSAADAEESDPDELFVVTTDDPAAVLHERFPGATYEFLFSDGHTHEWVFAVRNGTDTIASLYTSVTL
ncbi:hypothetical protein [Mycobacterium avium]|uniref:hypothetical protein n=1 Tax=Mycobacterium avium TaxID=1764 RepID=UPI001CC3A97E|nr:hypothetical protein [Mycobacterium avium]MBZ4514596.1 hypothetical protein [Mycobacterium avium subsp. hominissuis]MBZ4524137.1 hypothetical protein [Mycobacterium avium subsp. hominissuis]MBZ4543907.1 hypothetical protein [Mycobacterium avium subsp. hominissuis]MBZ4553013.1 hypothetical protein [Mycobacterium avium subsp. hominissuis]MBZ4562526.1 hypothetical protein [Mycobacterium avium subsp. hominissuis]